MGQPERDELTERIQDVVDVLWHPVDDRMLTERELARPGSEATDNAINAVGELCDALELDPPASTLDNHYAPILAIVREAWLAGRRSATLSDDGKLHPRIHELIADERTAGRPLPGWHYPPKLGEEEGVRQVLDLDAKIEANRQRARAEGRGA